MLPMLRQGKDSVTLSPINGRLRKYDLPLYRRDDGQFVLHRIVEVGEDYSCVGDNQIAIETGVRQDQLIGVVSEFGRGERRISVRSPIYRLYCVVWHYSRPMRAIWRGLKARLKKIIRKAE